MLDKNVQETEGFLKVTEEKLHLQDIQQPLRYYEFVDSSFPTWANLGQPEKMRQQDSRWQLKL